MTYDYAEYRPRLFTEEGVDTLLKIEASVQKHIKLSGAVRHDKATERVVGDSWLHLACLDYMVERGQIVRINPDSWGQHAVYGEASP